MIDRREVDAIFERQRQAVKRPTCPLSRRRQDNTPLRYVDVEHTLKVVPEWELPYLPSEQVVRVLGIDLGQVSDPAAMVLCCRRKPDANFVGPTYREMKGLKAEPVEVEWIKEFEKGTPYDTIAEAALNLHVWVGDDRQRVAIDCICFDMTGGGRPFRDLLIRMARELGFRGRCMGVNLTSSDTAVKVQNDGRGKFATVAKLEMLTAINILNQQNLLLLPPGRSTKRLLEQMQTFQPKKTASARITFEQGGVGHHGDVVIAAGLCAWYMSRGFRELSMNTEYGSEEQRWRS